MIAIDSGWIEANIKMFKKKKVVVVNGAGISVSSGIPDFRSKSGIFNEIKETLKVSGSDLFTYRFSIDKESRSMYLKYMSKLKAMVESAEPSFTHEFLCLYSGVSKEFRIYTQNIDGLEEKAGLVPKKDKSTKLVYLHGNMKELGCLYCGYRIPFTEVERLVYEKGEELICNNCLKCNEKRKGNRRERPIGLLHTTIIHYHQSHPDSAFISKMAELNSSCDLFIVMGTSLKVFGVAKLVKYFCRLDSTKGRRVFVNLERPTKEFCDLFDFFWQGDCDEFCRVIGKGLGIVPVLSGIRRLSISKKEDSGDIQNVERSLCEELNTIQISPLRSKNGEKEQKVCENASSDLKVADGRDGETCKEIPVVPRGKETKRRGKHSSSEKVSVEEFVIRETVVKKKVRGKKSVSMEGDFKKLFSSTATPLNTPKKEIPFVSDNITVEEEVQDYIDLLIKFSGKKASQRKSSRPKPSNTAPAEKSNRIKLKKKADKSVQEDEILQCMRNKTKKMSEGDRSKAKGTKTTRATSIKSSTASNTTHESEKS